MRDIVSILVMPRPERDRCDSGIAPDHEGAVVAQDVPASAVAPPVAPSTSSATSTGRLRLRFGLFVAVVLGLQAGPIYAQVLDLDLDLDLPLRGWQMFHSTGRDICDVRFTERTTDGRESRLTVQQVVDAVGTRGGGQGKYRLDDVTEIRALAQTYCAKSAGSKLHAVARCGHHEKGWRRVLRGSEDLCRKAK